MPGIDSNTVLMLQCNGTDASTTFTDDSANAHTVTAQGNAQIDTAQSKFGGASGLFDGTGDYLTIPDHTDFDFGSGDFTIEGWMRSTDTSTDMLFAQVTSGTSYMYFGKEGSSFRFRDYNAGNNIDFTRGIAVTAGQWYHLAVTRHGNIFRIFLNGVQQGTDYINSNSFITRTDPIEIGSLSINAGYYMSGHIDSIRVSKGIARWTGDFIPSTSAYDTSDPIHDAETVLMLHCNGTDTSTDFPDESRHNHLVASVGNAQIDTAQSKLGGASALFDNSGDLLNVSDSDDWGMGTEDFTIDYWVRFNTVSANDCMVSLYDDGGSNRCFLAIDGGGTGAIEFTATSGGATIALFKTPASTVTTGQWYHIAFVREGNNEHIFVDGVSQSLTYTVNPDATTNYPNISSVCRIGAQVFGWFLDGHMDEIRISKGIARWTTGFTPPTQEYPLDATPTVDEGETVEILDEIGMQITTDLGEEGIEVTDDAVIKFGKSTSESDEIEIEDSIELEASVNADEGVQVTDDILAYIPLQTIADAEGIQIGDSINVAVANPADFATKILSVNPLVFVSDTDPLEITKVDTTDPVNPTWTVYPISNTGETVRNARDVAYNSVEDMLYVATAEGKILKVDFTDFNTRTEIDLIDTDDLISIDAHEDFSRIITASDQIDGEVIVLDEAEIVGLSMDIRTVLNINTGLLTEVDTIFAKSLGLNVTTLLDVTKGLTVDVRVINLAFGDIAHNVIKRPDWDVAINSVLVPDVKWDDINIRHMADDESTATFILGRRHDELNKTIDGVSSIITNQNPVSIVIDGRLEFSGKITTIQCESDSETVSVTATSGSPKATNSKSITVPMSSLGVKLHPYDVLVHNPNIYNPYIDPNDDNPPFYKGIKTDLGLVTTQNVAKWQTIADTPVGGFFSQIPLGTPSLGSTALDIMEGNFKPKQNWTYFWGTITAENFTSGNVHDAFYVGTSLSGYSSETWELLQVRYRYQRIFADVLDQAYNFPVSAPGYTVQVPLTEAELKELPLDAPDEIKVRTEYRIGSAPFQDISARNGALFPKWRWEDKPTSLYSILDSKYDFRPYAVEIANLEYEKLKNINGSILPQTSASIEIMLDGYYYYGISILTRINVDNTTTAGIYKNLNGFPISVKAIDISSRSMRVTLTCDNQWSQGELESLDDQYPDEADYIEEPKEVYLATKFDPNRNENTA